MTPLTFTAGTWSTTQTVTVSAAADTDAVNDTATVSHAVSGGDYGTNNVTASDVAVTVSDDETVSTGVVLSVTRHYRVSAISGEGAGSVSVMVEANATDTVNGLTATGVAIEDTPNGMATIDLCWKPAGVAVNDLRNFAIRERSVHPSLPTEWSDQHWSAEQVDGCRLRGGKHRLPGHGGHCPEYPLRLSGSCQVRDGLGALE